MVHYPKKDTRERNILWDIVLTTSGQSSLPLLSKSALVRLTVLISLLQQIYHFDINFLLDVNYQFRFVIKFSFNCKLIPNSFVNSLFVQFFFFSSQINLISSGQSIEN